MTSVVVDTDVVSFLFKNDSRAQLYLPLLKNRKLLVSFMTEAELEQVDPIGQVGRESSPTIPRIHDRFCVGAFIPRLDPAVGRRDGRGESEWPPHRGCRCMDCRDRIALQRCSGYAQSEGLPGCAQPKRPELCLNFDGIAVRNYCPSKVDCSCDTPIAVVAGNWLWLRLQCQGGSQGSDRSPSTGG